MWECLVCYLSVNFGDEYNIEMVLVYFVMSWVILVWYLVVEGMGFWEVFSEVWMNYVFVLL